MGWNRLAALGFAAVAACQPAFAPPARIAIGAMPEPLAAGTGTLRVTGNSLANIPIGGEVRGEYGLNDQVTAEIGLSAAFPSYATFLLGGGGLRIHPFEHEWFRLGLSVSFGLGAGAGGGAGGWHQARAMSTALGLDLGVRFADWLGVYLGNRYQLSTARRRPTTHWGLHVLGAQVDVGRGPGKPPLFFGLEGGLIYLYRVGPLYEYAFATHLLGPYLWFGLTLGVRIEGGSATHMRGEVRPRQSVGSVRLRTQEQTAAPSELRTSW